VVEDLLAVKEKLEFQRLSKILELSLRNHAFMIVGYDSKRLKEALIEFFFTHIPVPIVDTDVEPDRFAHSFEREKYYILDVCSASSSAQEILDGFMLYRDFLIEKKPKLILFLCQEAYSYLLESCHDLYSIASYCYNLHDNSYTHIISEFDRSNLENALGELSEYTVSIVDKKDELIVYLHLRVAKEAAKLGELDLAIEHYMISLKIRQAIGDKSGEGTTLNNISQIYDARGDYDTALTYLKDSLKIRQAIGDKSGEGTTLNNISQIYDARGDYDTALTYLKDSLKIHQAIGDKSGEGTTLNNISQIYRAKEKGR